MFRKSETLPFDVDLLQHVPQIRGIGSFRSNGGEVVVNLIDGRKVAFEATLEQVQSEIANDGNALSPTETSV
ncbi:MAG: hypothetical protein QF793_03765 [Candidatus Peribacteraceae bacterium]|jgi:hypothetical protein|nr:hypothetical protein [bacterium]MDP6562013.1 hypothetical protein [Candidatus Peribacteraceae bacterium]|tara:strand:+ start:19225 stop:19440 length:216 start_codon:yes stop_codon:yes gene_type:complete